VDAFFSAVSRGFHPGYVIPVLAGLLLAALFPSGNVFTDPARRRTYRWIQWGTLMGALLGAKFAAIVGDLRWPIEPVDGSAVLGVGRSITGALLFGLLTAEILKPLAGFREAPNDRFAAVLPFSIAIGRVGCLMVGCCNGHETDSFFALPDADGVMRHPTALYDLLFHVALGITFVAILRRGTPGGRFAPPPFAGRLFALHLTLYGTFRFAIEPLRDSRDYLFGLSAYQIFSLAMLACGIVGLVRKLPLPAPSGPGTEHEHLRSAAVELA
jgi:phosphatidylglycerol:prolipoprotein diacylglycerol transferase